MKCCSVLCVLLMSVVSCFSLDREAFTFTKYDLDVRIEPEQQRLAARGTMVLRNDSAIPQKNASLQISSSLTWRSIQAAGKPLQFVSQPYESKAARWRPTTRRYAATPSMQPYEFCLVLQ